MADPRRRTLSLAILGAAALVVVAAVALYLVRGTQDRDVFLALIALLLLLVAAEVYLLFGARLVKAAAPKEEYLLADEAPVLREDVYDIKCGTCGTEFRVSDTLQRPLMAHCPACGAEGIVPVEAPKTGDIRIKCPRCETVNVLPDTGERPFLARCARCAATLTAR